MFKQVYIGFGVMSILPVCAALIYVWIGGNVVDVLRGLGAITGFGLSGLILTLLCDLFYRFFKALL